MEYTEIISIRATPIMKRQIAIATKELKINESDILRQYISNGLKNENLSLEFEKLKKIAIMSDAFSIGDMEIKLMLKKGSLVSNFKKTIIDLRQKKEVSNKKEIIDAFLNRIKEVFGNESSEYLDCLGFIKQR